MHGLHRHGLVLQPAMQGKTSNWSYDHVTYEHQPFDNLIIILMSTWQLSLNFNCSP
jgi:hypothetical protein